MVGVVVIVCLLDRVGGWCAGRLVSSMWAAWARRLSCDEYAGDAMQPAYLACIGVWRG